MPIYEYRCDKCNNSFEKLVFAGEEEDVKCPECGNRDVKRVISAFSFMGAGSGLGSCVSDSPKGFS